MQPSSSSFVERIIAAIRLDPAAYEEVEHDTEATWQAVAVVAVVSILSGIGASRGGTNGLVGGVVAAVVFWAIYAFFVYVVGTMLLRTPETSATFGQVLRPLGFSYAPSVFALLGVIPGIGGLIVLIAGLWSLVASIIAIRQALDVTTGRAVAIAVVAFLALVVILTLIVAVFGIGIYGIENAVLELREPQVAVRNVPST